MQPIYRQSQYRNTAVHQPGRAPQVNLPTPDTRHLTEAAAAMVDHADALESTLIDDIEYSASLAQQNRINDIVTRAQNEYTRRDNIPDGEPDSWYNKDSTFREQEFKTWENSILSQLTATPSKAFIRPESRQKALQAELETRQKLHTQFTAHLATSIPRHARKNFDTNLQTLTDQGNLQAATQLVTSAPSSVVGEQEKLALIHDLQQNDFILSAQTYAASGDPEAFLNYYTSIINQADRPTRLQLQKILNTIQPPAPKAGVTRKKDGTLTYEEEYPNLPPVPDYIYDFYTQAGGRPAFKADPTLRTQALSRLNQLAADMIHSDDPVVIETFKQIAACCAIDEGAADAILKPYLDDIRSISKYNPRQHTEQLLTWEHYASAEQSAELAALQNDINHYTKLKLQDARGELTENDPSAETINANLSALRAARSLIADNLKAKEKEIEAKAYAEFNRWRGTHPKATESEEVTAYWDIVDKYAPQNLKELPLFKQEMDSIIANSEARAADLTRRQEKLNAFIDNVNKTSKRRAEQESPSGAAVTSYFCPEDIEASARLPRSNAEPIVYLPSDSAETSESIKVAAGQTSIVAKVIKTDKVTSPDISNELRRQLGILAHGEQFNTILFSDTGARMVRTPSAASIADSIIRSEQRLDKNGNLAPYKLPDADRGGTHEIAGINNKHHPKEYAHLKKLYDEGKHQEVRKYAAAYITHFTQGAADTLTLAGIKSTAIESLCRDIYFNMGEKGLDSILYSVTGAQSDAEMLAALRKLRDTHSEQEICQLISDARLARYRRIIQNNKSQQVFWKGWQNRTQNALSTALSFIK